MECACANYVWKLYACPLDRFIKETIWRPSRGGFNGKTLYNFSGLKAKDKSKVRRRRSIAVLSSSGEVVRVSPMEELDAPDVVEEEMVDSVFKE